MGLLTRHFAAESRPCPHSWKCDFPQRSRRILETEEDGSGDPSYAEPMQHPCVQACEGRGAGYDAASD